MTKSPLIIVEGKNDVHVLLQLFHVNGIKVSIVPDEGAVATICETKQSLADGSGAEALISSIGMRVMAAGVPIGFVVDADPDKGVARRWESIRHQLNLVGVPTPNEMPTDGFIGFTEEYGIHVGVWLMPDNTANGNLEQFLMTLIRTDDQLFELACNSASQASLIERSFPQKCMDKAKIFTWLAWQETPGTPYGVAIKCRFFLESSPTTEKFIAWFRRLIEDGSEPPLK